MSAGVVASASMTAEESLLLLCCRPYLEDAEKDYLQRLVPSVRDWSLVLWRCEQYRILPLLDGHLREHVAVPVFVREYMRRWVALSRARSTQQLGELGRIVGSLEKHAIDYALLKGCGLAGLFYPDPLSRPMQDLDLLVRPEDAVRVQQLLFDLGYSHGLWDSDSESFTPTHVKLTRDKILNTIELPPFTRLRATRSPLRREQVLGAWRRQHVKCAISAEGVLVVPVFVDIHTNLSAGFDREDMWRGVTRRMLFGHPVQVQSPTAMLWFIAARLYVEAFVYNTLKLSMFGDVHTLLRKAGDQIEWPEILAVAFKYGMRAPLYHVFSAVMRLTDARVPLAVLAVLRPDSRELPVDNDWGDVLPKLLSRPIPSAASYYAR